MRLRTSIAVVGTLLGSIAAQAADAPDPEAWARSVLGNEAKLKSGAAFPETLALLADNGGSSVPLPVDQSLVESATYLDIKSPESIGLFFALNRYIPLAKGPVAEHKLRSATDADLVLVAGNSKLILFRRDVKGDLQSFQEMAAAKPNAAAINKLLFNSLRYNAVAIDQRGDYLLVKAPHIAQGRTVQGLIIKNSREAWSLRGRSGGGGDGLLQLARVGRGFSSFKVLMAPAGGSVSYGTKILLEGSP